MAIVQAGRSGPEIRSDLLVSLELRDSGRIDLELQSKVAPYYGESIRAQVLELLQRLGVGHGRVRVEDQGALPWVIAARVEAAARRAGVLGGDGRPERTVPPREPSARDRLRRSRLYLPGIEPKFMINAGLHGPDAVILDLEDSVHPHEKDTARLLVRNALRCVDFGTAERMVRINPLPLGMEDLEAVVPEEPDCILVPKAESAEQVQEVELAVARILEREGIRRPVWLMPILETALGIERAFEIARAADSVVALTIGLEDYTADLGVRRSDEGLESLWARQRLVNAARAAGLQPIDSVYSDVADLEGLRAWASRSKALGFEGMGCIHPRQIPLIHEAYAPTPQELAWARQVVEAFREAEAAGRAVATLGSKMVDPPVVERARKILARAGVEA